MAPGHRPYVFDYDEDDPVYVSDDEGDLLDYDSNTPSPELITIEDDDEDAATMDRQTQRSTSHLNIQFPETGEDTLSLPGGAKITTGTTLELKDRSRQKGDALHSGDFLRVQHIIRNLETDEVRLRGFRLRRTKYLGQMLDWKLNELVLVLHVDENESGSPFVNGMVDICPTEVLGVRDCVMTNKPYPSLSFRDPIVPRPNLMRSNEEVREWLFHHGRLVCRVVNILFLYRNGKAYGGEVRHLRSNEVDAEHAMPPSLLQGGASDSSIEIDDDEDERDIVIVSKCGKRLPIKARAWPTKSMRYTFGDCFCGAGGASQGAIQAGMTVCWGLDFDDAAIAAYSQNHLGALPFCGNAHDFPPKGATLEELRVDVLHLSPPCCYWSPAHTHNGRNDQANYEAIYTVGPILKKVQPRVATLEQTFGLATHEQHKKNFLLLMNDIGKAGYDLRYKIVNMCEFGLPQQRKRLLIIAAKRGTPLPPFPKPTHGGPGSGLKPIVSVADALEPLERLGNRAYRDEFHQPNHSKLLNKTPYDPRTSLVKGCITTSGGENYHYSGLRKYTPRELGLFQTFPINYQFFGPQSEATKQIGNAFPPVMAEALYRSVAKTLEAFDHRLINAEDEIHDLDATLQEKEVSLPRSSSNLQSSGAPRSPYQYLVRDDSRSSSGASKTGTSSSIWDRRTEVEPTRPDFKRERASASLPFRATRDRRRVQADAELAHANGESIVLD
ncbi:S-adenosyl-L-methionine-dependent methyltransferase [Lentithecium fluviatile CBS 122367]|uniref:DNA (cytosine-5-)-methyltransferase n=1 Tax=Lentithecium fluviatile CBS 122367 TaxID=1168545 RepID=A0A6G1JHG3_9PLEO|nr:S-adenosyl-L-methionine-dependent methyltransferase [Lentithecium fluviatile CBS 122367]